MATVNEMFGSMVFSDHVMKQRLPKETYKALQKTINAGADLDISVANVVANAMKDWALEKGATHYTHWFQPMTGITAEKHDSFITPTNDGRVLMEFSGGELVRGEPDASSFPSGGIRATFEARGYTVWDPTSAAFVKGATLYIPTAFCSYTGEALDAKTPLLRSMEAVSKQAVRVLHLFGNKDVTAVKSTVGPEQEYFLIDKALYEQRRDLVFTGRTLFGNKPPKGQELEDQYFAAIKTRVAAFMNELNEELWKLGVLAKTEHNEVAPAQHELAPIFSTTNIAVDHNHLTMELMQRIAKKYDMICLLHEKPFAGVNGSGKHNNWSIATNTGTNLLDPGKTPFENAQFLLFLAAVIKAVDEHQDLLRISVATAANDHRLGANEAPPAIISIFLGDELTAIVEAIDSGSSYDSKSKTMMKIGVDVLPQFPKDTTDRNRTSPFAFTGNKFEFRMAGSSMSIAEANTVLNTAVAESLRVFADALENATDFNAVLTKLVKETIKKHKRIIFNGNGYDDAWVVEAEKRGLLNLKSTPEALPYLIQEKNVKLFKTHGVYSEKELHSRFEIALENYCKILNIEALTMLEIAKTSILPAVTGYAKKLAEAANAKKALIAGVDVSFETACVSRISELTGDLYKGTIALEEVLAKTEAITGTAEMSMAYKTNVIPVMDSVRAAADALELITAKKAWPLPTYGDMLFSVL
ncbi:glutamine synthetase III [Oscillospiraceae bacterium CM]|nr:glutamine synthetase III [Oscillospiraceae bacterium CM]